jgi:hypothetical protein
MEREPDEVRAGRERRLSMAEELRKAELVRDRLEGLVRLTGTFPEGHAMRARLENLHLEHALGEVEGEVRDLTDRLLYPRGT